MNPTSNIAFALIVGFVVFITVRGELPAYLCVIGLGSNCPPAPSGSIFSSSGAPSSGSGSTINSGNGGNVLSTIGANGGLGTIPLYPIIGTGSPDTGEGDTTGTSTTTISFPGLGDEGSGGGSADEAYLESLFSGYQYSDNVEEDV